MDAELQEQDELEARAKTRLGAVLRDKYQLDRVIGFGGMATVYAATHRNGKEVALKLLHPELAFHSEVRARFLREGYVANQVKHAGAVSVIDDDTTEDGWAFLVMELLQGLSVQELWEKRGMRLHPAWVTAITLQLLDVMMSAHQHGIIHRDIKPANLFVTNEGELKVLDFGIARMRDVGHKTTNTGAVLGTPAFMAPEQALASSKEIEERTDLWAIGGVAFALLVGEVVHPAENTQQTLVHAATRHARALAPLAPDAPPGIVRVLEKALAFDKANRWASAVEMRDALVEAAVEAYGEAPGADVLRTAMQGAAAPPRVVHKVETIDLASSERAEASSKPSTLAELATGMTLPGLSAPAYSRPMMTTGGPVSSLRAVEGARLSFLARARARGTRGAMLAGGMVVMGALFAMRSASSGMARASASSASPSVALANPTPSVELVHEASVLIPPPASGEMEVVESEATSTSAPAVQIAARPHPSAAPQPSAPASVAARPSCTPPFVINPKTGRKIWKMECL